VIDCLCISGPTACGKTDLALELAERIGAEIVSMDSALVYRGMDIGTAKPSAVARARVPHHLIDIVDPSEAYSAGRFAADALVAARAIAARGLTPLLVGGTLLYLRAFRDGLAEIPSADRHVRRRIDAAAAKCGWPALHERLMQIDPDAGRRIAPTDRQRIQRALEVYELTGEVISTHQSRATDHSGAVRVRTLALIDEDRSALAQRIEARFDAMVDVGLIDEVRALMGRGDLSPDLPAIRAVGYRQIWAYLDGAYDWPEARRRSITATRQLAKRQMTWLRSEQNLHALPWSYPGRIEAALEWACAAQRQA